MKSKIFFLLVIALFMFVKHGFAVGISWSVDASSLTNILTNTGNKAINLNPTGLTSVGITTNYGRSVGESVDVEYAFGTITTSGTFVFLSPVDTLYTKSFKLYPDTGFSIDGSLPVDPTKIVNNVFVLFTKNVFGNNVWEINKSNRYITNYPLNSLPFYRYNCPSQSRHFYSIDPTEVGQNPSWTLEGTTGSAYNQQVTGTVPYYRYYSSTANDHFYTLTQGSYSGYSYEGIAAFVYNASVSDTHPLYQYYKPTGGHFYTNDYNELGGGSQGFTYNGIACYLITP